jgi:hypothetical protein
MHSGKELVLLDPIQGHNTSAFTASQKSNYKTKHYARARLLSIHKKPFLKVSILFLKSKTHSRPEYCYNHDQNQLQLKVCILVRGRLAAK